MPLEAGGRACVNCGDPFPGPGDLCVDCTPVSTPGRPDLGLCPHCAAPLPWEKVNRMSRSHADGTMEVLYYCPACRAILEAACWIQLKGTKTWGLGS